MKVLDGLRCGMGIGGWLTNYKRFNVLPQAWRPVITAGDLEHFETYITEADVENIAGMGMDHVRLGFDQLVLEEAPYVYRSAIVNKLEDFVHWCRKHGLQVVLNLHKAIGNYCDIQEDVTLFDSQDLMDRFTALWVMLEEKFHAYPEVAFELLNEVRDVDPELWNNLAARTVCALREKNPTRRIIIGSTAWNSPDRLADLRLYKDENIIYTFHTYAPFEFTHQQGVLQAEPLYYNRKMPYPTEDMERYRDFQRVVKGNDNAYVGFGKMDIHFLRASLAGAASFQKAHPDKALWCGEFGTIRHCPIAYRENWMRDIITILKEWDIPYCV